MLREKLSRWLITPSKELTKAGDIRRARLLSAMLIPMVVLTPIGSMTSTIPAEQQSVGFLFFVVSLAYIFSRTRYYLPAGIFAVISILIPPYVLLFTMEEFTQFTVVTTLSWMNLSLLMGSIWLPMRPIFIIWLMNLLFLLLVPILFIGDLTYHTLSTGFMQLLIFGSIILMSAQLRNNDQENLILQTKEMKNAKNEAEKSNQAKSAFLAIMSHEFRTPLHGIMGFTQFGLDKLGKIPEDNIRLYFERIKSSAERLKILIEDLLSLNTLANGKMAFHFEKVALLPVIEQCIAELDSQIKINNYVINIDFNKDIPVVECDKNRINQILMNVLGNAIKFSPKGGTISVTVNRTKILDDDNSVDAVEIKITDQGSGINEGEQEIIFNEFYQSSQNKFRTGSTGLGLAISQKLVLAHHGKIWCENNSDGGAAFYFRLPIKHKEIQE